MNAAFAALVGVIIGATLKHYFDLRAGRQAKLLDEKLKHAVAFLSAADWAGRIFEVQRSATSAHGRDTTQGTSRERVDADERRESAWQQGEAALKDAHTAACALRLLMPELGNAPGDYIALSVVIDYSQDDRAAREDARAALEAKLIKAFRTSRKRILAAK